jgi:hypothetical protein
VIQYENTKRGFPDYVIRYGPIVLDFDAHGVFLGSTFTFTGTKLIRTEDDAKYVPSSGDGELPATGGNSTKKEKVKELINRVKKFSEDGISYSITVKGNRKYYIDLSTNLINRIEFKHSIVKSNASEHLLIDENKELDDSSL